MNQLTKYKLIDQIFEIPSMVFSEQIKNNGWNNTKISLCQNEKIALVADL